MRSRRLAPIGLGFALSIFGIVMAAGCGSSSTSAGIPEVEPPVTKATPAGLKTTVLMATARAALAGGDWSTMALSVPEIKSRFFQDGPTEVETLLDAIDARIAEINTRSGESDHACLSNAAVAYDISVLGTTQTTYMQCYDTFDGGAGGMVFGKNGDTWYLFENSGQSRSLAVITPVAGTTDDYTVEAWLSVGQANASDASCSSTWYGCSYGVIHLKADSSTSAMELTTAGTGLGFCGAHLMSDGTNVYVTGSTGGTSDGSSWSCVANDTNCVLASDATTAGTCTSVDDNDFTLSSLGVTGHTMFGTGVTVDGTSTDSVHFGPNVADFASIPGISAF